MGVRETLVKPQYVIPTLRVMARRDWTSRLLTRSLAPFNPLDPRRYTDPYELYEELRASGPLFHHHRLDGWITSGFAESEAVLRADVSVDRNAILDVVSPYKNMDPASLDLFKSLLLTVDPPRHTRLRGLVSRAFTPRAVARMEPRVAEVASELLDALPATANRSGARRPNQVDLSAGFASQLPIYVIGELLGLPRDQRARLKELSDIVAHFVDPLTGFDAMEMDLALEELQEIFDVEIERRRRKPSDDILSVLVSAAEDGDRLTNTELHSMILLLMAAGHETTTGLIGNALFWLDRNLDARGQLVDEPDLMANAVEEFLRFDSPVQATDRLALTDIAIDGHRIREGSVITVLLGAANRDPRKFDRPNELLVDREAPRSLSFGHGVHHCVGAALARMEARVGLAALLDRYPDYRVVHDEVRWKRSITLRGPTALPAVLVPTGSSARTGRLDAGTGPVTA
ncbi:MAG: cytochrome P450 [Actinomycetota bacterium]